MMPPMHKKYIATAGVLVVAFGLAVRSCFSGLENQKLPTPESPANPLTAAGSSFPMIAISDLTAQAEESESARSQRFFDQLQGLSFFQSDLPPEWLQHFSHTSQHGYQHPLNLIKNGRLIATGWNFKDVVPDSEDKRAGLEATAIAIDPETGDFYILSLSQTGYRDESSSHETQWHMAFVLETDIYGAYSHMTKAATGTGVFETEPQEVAIGDTPSFWMTSQTRDANGKIINDVHQLRWEGRQRDEGPGTLVFSTRDGVRSLSRAVWHGQDQYGHVAREPDGSYGYYYNVREGEHMMPGQTSDYNAWPADVRSFMERYQAQGGFNIAPPAPGQP
jgi:hypothetical protein